MRLRASGRGAGLGEGCEGWERCRFGGLELGRWDLSEVRKLQSHMMTIIVGKGMQAYYNMLLCIYVYYMILLHKKLIYH